jgi:hypothetical protein
MALVGPLDLRFRMLRAYWMTVRMTSKEEDRNIRKQRRKEKKDK